MTIDPKIPQAVLGMGNALVDIMTTMNDDKLLEEFQLRKGSMQLVDRAFSDLIVGKTASLKQQISSGGSAANTIHGLANLGIDTGFLGKIGRDEFGILFREDMEKSNIEPILHFSESDSGRAIALVSPDSERTFATFLGAAVELTPADIEPSLFDGFTIFHTEGYLVQNHELMLKALKTAKDKGLTISLDMASYNVVESNLEFLKSIIWEYVDIVFANEEEARAFTGQEPEEALSKLSHSCNIAIVKIGSRGSLVKQAEERFEIGVIPVKSIDTTGAGDLYASGFLYGYANGWPLDRCGRAGALLAGKVIEVLGAKIDEPRWKEIHRALKMI